MLRGNRGRLLATSLPHPNGTRLRLDLQADGELVSGNWVEHEIGGRTAYGTVRLLLDPSRSRMVGRWLSFGERSHVLSGNWELVLLEPAVSGRLLLSHKGLPV